MKTSDFYYDLPESLIAQTPLPKRDASRLFVYHRANGKIEHKKFTDIVEYLNPGDGLLLNETKVIPARLFGEKKNTGGEVEFLLLNRLSMDTWEIIMKPGRKLRVTDTVVFDETLSAEIVEKKKDGMTTVRFTFSGVFEDVLDRLGHVPLPPYIRSKLKDKDRYQTVYAAEAGSAAAPTAGLHFTKELLEKIQKKGVNILPVTLHVGLGTFRPVKTQDLKSHKMHAEHFTVKQATADAFNRIKRNKKRIIAVGTTSVRVAETIADEQGLMKAASGWTDIFIYPGYRFRAIDTIITNFHLPESTLLMLVCAFIGREDTLNAYRTAVRENYRFFSFGDAMYID